MHRRSFCTTTGLTTLAALATFPVTGRKQAQGSEQTSSSAALDTVTRKRFLLLDLWKLDAWNNCDLHLGRTEFVPEATYVDDTLENQGAGKPSVYFDQRAGVWRMLYNLGWSPVRLMAAVSDDGVRWHPDPHPELEWPQDAGLRLAEHQVFQLPDVTAGGLYRDPIADDGLPFKMFAQARGSLVLQRALAYPTHAWHGIARDEGDKRYFHESLLLVSADGLRWQPDWERHWSRLDWHPEPPYFAFYNSGHQQHSMLARPGWGDRRVAIQSTQDFRDWSEPELLLQMDILDRDAVGFYALPVIPYAQMYIGLLWVFHNSSHRPVDSFNQFFGTMDAQLTYSYDGVHFLRSLREPFLPLNQAPEHGCSQLRPYSIVEHGNEIRIYSGAAQATHGREQKLERAGVASKAITMHRLRLDGWTCLRSRGDWARLITKPLGIFAPDIRLNAAASFGCVRYQITDERSQALKGFTFEDCIPLEADDQVDWLLTWRETHSRELIGKVIRIEIEFENAEIYALDAVYHMLDAQDQWLLKDHKPIDAARFDF